MRPVAGLLIDAIRGLPPCLLCPVYRVVRTGVPGVVGRRSPHPTPPARPRCDRSGLCPPTGFPVASSPSPASWLN